MTTTIDSIVSLPSGPYNGTPYVGIVITSGISSFFKITGANLDKIVSVAWYPSNPASVLQDSRNIILVDNTLGTFMIRVIDNYLDITDRGGYIGFRLDNGTTLSAPVKTYGRLSLMPLWQSPNSGLNTG